MNRLTDPDAEIRNRAAMALGHLGSSAKLACPQLVKMLETEKEGSMRMRAASALGAVFFETYPDELDNIAIIALARALRADPSLLVRVQACASLKNIGPGAKDALGDLIDAMLKKEDDTTLSDAARDAFAWVAGPECKEHVPRLLEVYRKGERDTTMQFRILWALGKIGAHENEVVPLLVSALKDKDPGKKRLRAAGAVGLGEMRGKAKDAVPALIEALEESLKPDHDKSLNLRSSALEALRKIGPHAKAALPVLQKIANDSQYDRATRNSAALAVKSIEGSKK
jgi:HEAT repeat protein